MVCRLNVKKNSEDMTKSARFLFFLFLFTLFNVGLIVGLLPRVWPERFSDAPVYQLQGWADAPGKHKGQGDSWTPMTDAYRHYQAHPEQLIYTHIFFEEKTKFQYPPTSLFLMTPLERLAEDQTFRLINGLNWVSWIFVALSGPLTFAVFYLSWRKYVGAWPAVLWWSLPLILLLSLFFYPITRGYHIGQVQVWLNGMAALLLICWLLGREPLAGVLVGVMCLIKPQYGVIYLWGLVRRRWGFALAATITGGFGVLLSLWLFGLANHLDYLPAVSFMSRHGEVFYPNQSVNGLLNRWYQTGPVMGFMMNDFAAYHPVVYYGTLISSLLLIGVTLSGHWSLDTGHLGNSADLSLALLIGTMASPIAWEHHYGILLPIFGLVVPLLVANRVGRWGWVLLSLAYILCANHLLLFNRLWATGWNVLLSYLFFGALILGGFLLHFRSRPIQQKRANEASN